MKTIKLNFMKKLLLSMLMITLSLSLAAQFGGGQGTEEDPWRINREQHLDEIRERLGAEHTDEYYVQTADLNLGQPPWNEVEGWQPLGMLDAPFMGHFNGNGFTITGLTIDRGVARQGLFAFIEDATIENITLLDADVTSGGRSGVLIATADNSTVRNCFVSGTFTPRAQANAFLVAEPTDTTILNCGADVEMFISGFNNGGLVGDAQNLILRNSFVYGTMTAGDGLVSGQRSGPLVANLTASFMPAGESEVTNCYARVTMDYEETTNASSVGGLIGSVGSRCTVSNSYASTRILGGRTPGGLIASNSGTVTNSYWDTEVSGLQNSEGGTGRTTQQMLYPYADGTYDNWDFEEIWEHDTGRDINEGYPYLFHQAPPPPDIDAPVVSIEKFTEDEQEFVRVEWEPVEDALSYKVYLSDNPYRQNWGEAITITEDTFYITEAEETGIKFFFVTASPEPAP